MCDARGGQFRIFCGVEVPGRSYFVVLLKLVVVGMRGWDGMGWDGGGMDDGLMDFDATFAGVELPTL